MQIYKITIRFLNYIGTPLHSDTIFGHFCWIYRYIYGQKRLKEDILKNYETSPNIIFSCGFPSGYLPRPVLAPVSLKELENLIKENLIKDEPFLKRLEILKEIKKIKFLPIKTLENLHKNLSEINIIKVLLKEEALPTIHQFVMPHNSICRLSGRVQEFYHIDYIFYKSENSYFDIDIYLKTTTIAEEKIREVFKVLGSYGFGKDKNLGAGHFKLLNVEEVSFPQEGNAVMSLSYFVPDNGLKDGYYSLLTKFGKLGGHYAITEIPFKNPLILMEPGSVFKIETIKDYYGVAIKNIHARMKIKHQTYLFPYFVRLLEEKHVS